MTKVMCEDYGNPSSLHRKGVQAEQYIRYAKETIAKNLKVNEKEIFFTSGGTESDNLAIRGCAYANSRRGKHLITTQIEHPAILQTMRQLEEEGYRVTYLPVDEKGCIRLEDLERAITGETILVSIMHTNNEVGSLQPIEEAGAVIKRMDSRILFHVDAVQGYGKFRIHPKKMNIDLLSVSGHKIHGPKGIGALYIKDGVMVRPFLYGGKQERGIKPGTENVPLACAFGYAADKLLPRIRENFQYVQTLQNYLIHKLQEIPQVRLTMTKNISPYILNFSIPGIPSQETVSHFSMENIYIAAGSACSKGEPSHVIAAMGLPEEVVSSVIRVSFCRYNTTEEIDRFIAVLKQWIETNRSRCILA